MALGNTAKLVVQIVTDASKAGDGIDAATKKVDGFKGAMGALVGPAAAVAGGVALIGAGAVTAASDAEQAFGGLDAVFGESAAQVKTWAEGAADAVGLSAAEYGNFASVVGAQLKNLGVPMEDVAGNTDGLIQLGADLAATYGGTTADAVSALSSALRGEADPAERYGLALNQTAVNAALAEEGLDGLTGEAATAAKAQTIMKLATEQAGGAVGQFGRESDTVAGQQQRLTASWQNAAATLGEALLPIITPVISAFADLAGWVQKNASWLMPLVLAIGALAVGILAVNVAMSAWTAIQGALKIATAISTAAQWAFNAALSANPIGIIILLVVGLIAAIVLLWNKNKAFRDFFIAAWKNISSFFKTVWEGMKQVVKVVVDWIVNAWRTTTRFISDAFRTAVKIVTDIFRDLKRIAADVLDAILKPIDWIVDAFNNVVGAIKNVIDWLSRIKIPDVFGAIGDFIGGRSVAVAGAPAGVQAFGVGAYSTAGARLSSGRSAVVERSVVNITVNGGLDSADTIARRIRQILDTRDRRAGGVVLNRKARP